MYVSKENREYYAIIEDCSNNSMIIETQLRNAAVIPDSDTFYYDNIQDNAQGDINHDNEDRYKYRIGESLGNVWHGQSSDKAIEVYKNFMKPEKEKYTDLLNKYSGFLRNTVDPEYSKAEEGIKYKADMI